MSASSAKVVVAVVNCGSSSVKLDVFTWPDEANPMSVLTERIGNPGTRMRLERLGVDVREPKEEVRELSVGMVGDAVAAALDEVSAARLVPDIVGHRVVHGGSVFTDSVRIDDRVLAQIKACVPLAPLHNPANLAGIEVARQRLPNAPHVAVFDTAFHQTLAPEAYLYAIPRALADEGVRRYGFHGTSHRYVAERAALFMGKPLASLKLVTCHLGNGCSVTAVDGGKSVDTSMGMTPVEGLVMGTRCGDIDPAVVLQLARKRGVDDAEKVLNKESGLLGLSRKSNDMRDLEKAASAGDADADLAVRVFARRVRKYVGAYAAVMGGLDAVVFTGGIGENSVRVRREVCAGLAVVGAVVDEERNAAKERGERDVARADSRARVLVIPTDEERTIARDAVRLASS